MSQAVLLIMIIAMLRKAEKKILRYFLLCKIPEKKTSLNVWWVDHRLVAHFFCCSSYNKTLSLSFSSRRDVPAKNIASQVGACTFLTTSFFKFLILIWTIAGWQHVYFFVVILMCGLEMHNTHIHTPGLPYPRQQTDLETPRLQLYQMTSCLPQLHIIKYTVRTCCSALCGLHSGLDGSVSLGMVNSS